MSRPILNLAAVLTMLVASLATAAFAGFPGTAPARDQDFYDNGSPPAARVELGRRLFYDKLLSGNLNISCASCHHSLTATGDGLSLPVGEGGIGLGVTRDTGSGHHAIHERVPRNAPALFNLGAREFTRMFHDGRVEADAGQPSGFASPAGEALPAGLDNVLAAQAMFPVTSAAEMAGQAGENEQANLAAAKQLPELWDFIAQKLQLFDGYVTLFMAAFPGEINQASDITFVHAANAIAAFEAQAWRFDNSPFDAYLRGDHQALGSKARQGMNVFYGKGGCSACHAGTFQTDHQFYAIAMPQIGPGKGDGADSFTSGHEDFGRERVSNEPTDRFRFRTPSLRNVALTAPYGHSGAFNTLEGVIRHHLDAVNSLYQYDRRQAVLPSRADLNALDFVVMDDEVRVEAIAAACEIKPNPLKAREIDALVAFMHALTDPAVLDMRGDVPGQLPSGLSLAE